MSIEKLRVDIGEIEKGWDEFPRSLILTILRALLDEHERIKDLAIQRERDHTWRTAEEAIRRYGESE